MPNYLMLGHFTDEGINTVQDSPERIKRFKDICQGEGAKVTSYHMLMGQYDLACFVEAPNQDIIAKIAMLVGKRGHVRTETMSAFNESEIANLVNKLS